MIEKAPNVTVQHPVQLLPRDRDVQRIQSLMLAAPWPETIRETPKILLVNLIEDGVHGLLNNLVLQRRNSQRPLSAVRFRNIHPSRWLRSVRATVNPAVQVGDPTFHPGLILFPCGAIHSRSGLTLQGVKTIPEEVDS